jgi:hypothetical protein
VREAVAVVVGELRAVWTDQLPTHEREQARPNEGGLEWRQELGDRSAVKASALDRGPLERGALARLEPVDAGGEKRSQRRRHADLTIRFPVSSLHGKQLLDEERVPLGHLEHARAQAPRECAGLRAGVDQRVDLRLGEWLEEKELRRRSQLCPRRARFEQLGPRACEQQNRFAGAETGDVLEEVEEGRLGPVQIFEHDDERALMRERLQQPSHRPVRLVHRPQSFRGADGTGDEVGDEIAGLVFTEQLRDNRPRLFLRHLLHDLDQWPVGDALAVGQTPSDQHARLLADGPDSFAQQARLADPGLAEHGHELAAPLSDRALKTRRKGRELLLTTDERGRERTREGGDLRENAEQTPGRDGMCLALEHQLVNGLDEHRLLHQPERWLTDQDFAAGSALLQSCGDVHGIAGDERLAWAGDDFAGADARPRLELSPVVALQIDVERREPEPHLARRPHRPELVVFVGEREAEDGHHGVADELLDRAAVSLQHRAHRLVPACHHAAERFRVEPLAERRRLDQVAEEDGDDLAHRAWRRVSRGERGGTTRTEVGVVGVLPPTMATDGHGAEFRPINYRSPNGLEGIPCRRTPVAAVLRGRRSAVTSSCGTPAKSCHSIALSRV